MKVVLFQPQIPQNAGNVARTCAAVNAELILVRPLGFSLSDRQMKRAGLDYWDRVSVDVIDELEPWLESTEDPFFFFSSKATHSYHEAPFTERSILIFGSETTGLPAQLWERYVKRFYTIPMAEGQRCLNLASSAAIVLYEAQRQLNFTFAGKKESLESSTLH